jgi:aminodeoxyfutalosine deaminase
MLIKADAIITMAGPVYTPGLIRVEETRIVEVGDHLSTAGENVIDYSASGRLTVILPGLIDCHCHLELSGLAGKIKFKKGGSFLSWLMKILLFRPKRTATQNRWIKLGIQQCLAGGTTTVADISANNLSWRTLINEPIRKICFAEVLGFGPKADTALDGLRERMQPMPEETECFLKGISPHAPYSTDQIVFRQAMKLANENHWRIMTHLAEHPAEEELIRRGRGPWRKVLKTLRLWDGRFKPAGQTPIAWAADLGLLQQDVNVLLAHVNYVNNEDIDILAAGNAAVVYCPLAHRYFHHTPHRYRDMLAAGVNVVLGCDSLACSPSLSMLDQMREVYRAGGMEPQTILKMGTIQAAKSLYLDHRLGTLQAGKLADLIILTLDPRYQNSLFTGLLDPAAAIQTTMVNGKIVYNNEKF